MLTDVADKLAGPAAASRGDVADGGLALRAGPVQLRVGAVVVLWVALARVRMGKRLWTGLVRVASLWTLTPTPTDKPDPFPFDLTPTSP